MESRVIINKLIINFDCKSQLNCEIKSFSNSGLGIENDPISYFKILKIRNIKVINNRNELISTCDLNNKATNSIYEYSSYEISDYQKIFRMFDNKNTINLTTDSNDLGYFINQEKYSGQAYLRYDCDALIKKVKEVYNLLSFREIECAACWANCNSAKEIARIINISPRTVEKFICNIMSKLQVSNKNYFIHKIHHDKSIYIFRDLYDLMYEYTFTRIFKI